MGAGNLNIPVVEGFGREVAIQGASQPGLQELFVVSLQKEKNPVFGRIA